MIFRLSTQRWPRAVGQFFGFLMGSSATFHSEGKVFARLIETFGILPIPRNLRLPVSWQGRPRAKRPVVGVFNGGISAFAVHRLPHEAIQSFASGCGAKSVLLDLSGARHNVWFPVDLGENEERPPKCLNIVNVRRGVVYVWFRCIYGLAQGTDGFWAGQSGCEAAT